MNPIKQSVHTFASPGKDKKRVSLIEDEEHSYGAILVELDKRLDMRTIIDWPISSKPWSICSEKGGSISLSKSLFQNNLQLLSPVPSGSSAPIGIDCCIVDAMRVVRMITIKDLKSFTYLWVLSGKSRWLPDVNSRYMQSFIFCLTTIADPITQHCICLVIGMTTKIWSCFQLI